MRYLWVISGLALAGCTYSTGAMPLGDGNYMVTVEHENLVGTAQRKAVDAATSHCAKLGQVVEPGEAMPIRGYAGYPGFSFRFRCKPA
jgi:hypothetical protein